MRANVERAPVAPIKRIITKIRVATVKQRRSAIRATEKAPLSNVLRIIKETRSFCKRFFKFFLKTGKNRVEPTSKREERVRMRVVRGLREKPVAPVERITSEKKATNRELSGRGASKRIDAEILSVIII